MAGEILVQHQKNKKTAARSDRNQEIFPVYFWTEVHACFFSRSDAEV